MSIPYSKKIRYIHNTHKKSMHVFFHLISKHYFISNFLISVFFLNMQNITVFILTDSTKISLAQEIESQVCMREAYRDQSAAKHLFQKQTDRNPKFCISIATSCFIYYNRFNKNCTFQYHTKYSTCVTGMIHLQKFCNITTDTDNVALNLLNLNMLLFNLICYQCEALIQYNAYDFHVFCHGQWLYLMKFILRQF